MFSELDREKVIASFKDKKSIDKRAKRRVDNIVRHVRTHLDKFSEDDKAKWDKLVAVVDRDDTPIRTYTLQRNYWTNRVQSTKTSSSIITQANAYVQMSPASAPMIVGTATRKLGRCCNVAQ